MSFALAQWSEHIGMNFYSPNLSCAHPWPIRTEDSSYVPPISYHLPSTIPFTTLTAWSKADYSPTLSSQTTLGCLTNARSTEHYQSYRTALSNSEPIINSILTSKTIPDTRYIPDGSSSPLKSILQLNPINPPDSNLTRINSTSLVNDMYPNNNVDVPKGLLDESDSPSDFSVQNRSENEAFETITELTPRFQPSLGREDHTQFSSSPVKYKEHIIEHNCKLEEKFPSTVWTTENIDNEISHNYSTNLSSKMTADQPTNPRRLALTNSSTEPHRPSTNELICSNKPFIPFTPPLTQINPYDNHINKPADNYPFGRSFLSPLHNRPTFPPTTPYNQTRHFGGHLSFTSHVPKTPGFGMDSTRRKNATRESTTTLKVWLQEHIKNPYPTKGEKIMLAIITKMTLTQVSTWFANARRRLKKENKMSWPPKLTSSQSANHQNAPNDRLSNQNRMQENQYSSESDIGGLKKRSILRSDKDDEMDSESLLETDVHEDEVDEGLDDDDEYSEPENSYQRKEDDMAQIYNGFEAYTNGMKTNGMTHQSIFNPHLLNTNEHSRLSLTIPLQSDLSGNKALTTELQNYRQRNPIHDNVAQSSIKSIETLNDSNVQTQTPPTNMSSSNNDYLRNTGTSMFDAFSLGPHPLSFMYPNQFPHSIANFHQPQIPSNSVECVRDAVERSEAFENLRRSADAYINSSSLAVENSRDRLNYALSTKFDYPTEHKLLL